MSDVSFIRSFDAIGSTATVLTTEEDALERAKRITSEEVSALDLAASRFRPDSELLALQRTPGRAISVSETLFVALDEARSAAESTGGLLDPTVGEAIELCGYDRDFALVDPTGPPLKVRLRRTPGWQGIRLDRSNRTVVVPPGVRIDLGATAKAGCADRAAARASIACGCGVLVNLGGDIAVSGDPPHGGWVVRVADRHDADPDAASVTIVVREGGLATSGTTARRWRRGGELLHHVIDPTTGMPASPHWRTVTVAADSCLAANVASTAAIVLGPAAPGWLAERGLHARLVPECGPVVGVGAWPEDALEPISVTDEETVRC